MSVTANKARPSFSVVIHRVGLTKILVGLAVAFLVMLEIHPVSYQVPILGLIPIILRGLPVTLELTLLGSVLACILAILIGILRTSPIWIIRAATGLYVEFFRGTSILVQMFWIYFVLPNPPFNINLTAMQAGVLALGLNVGAYGSEAVRGAIQAIPKEQIEAATALNMSPILLMRHVILPQAMVRILPPFGNLMIELLKATSLASLITLADITFQGRLMIQSIGRMGEIFGLLFVFYFALAYPITLGIRWIERRRRWE